MAPHQEDGPVMRRFSWLVAAATMTTGMIGIKAWPPLVRVVLTGAAVGLWLTVVVVRP